ncbi:MAG: DNA-binding response regulator [Planctomycetaceae bacterium]|nr:MAG: DNA-binding response regulator [Planctomycetaceae bacterium]
MLLAGKEIQIVAHDNPSYVARAVVLGAEDFLLKDSPAEAYVAAIHRAVAGGELAVFGYMDDAAVIGICIRMAHNYIQEYRQWRNAKAIT